MKKKYTDILKESLIDFGSAKKVSTPVDEILGYSGKGNLTTHKAAKSIVSVLENMYAQEDSDFSYLSEGEETEVAQGEKTVSKVQPDTKKTDLAKVATEAEGAAHVNPDDTNEFEDTIIDSKTDDKTLATESVEEAVFEDGDVSDLDSEPQAPVPAQAPVAPKAPVGGENGPAVIEPLQKNEAEDVGEGEFGADRTQEIEQPLDNTDELGTGGVDGLGEGEENPEDELSQLPADADSDSDLDELPSDEDSGDVETGLGDDEECEDCQQVVTDDEQVPEVAPDQDAEQVPDEAGAEAPVEGDGLDQVPGEEDAEAPVDGEEGDVDPTLDVDDEMRESIVSREGTEESIVERLIREMNLHTESITDLDETDLEGIEED